jgi:polyisoprenoid-binding protein YceI
MDRSRKLAAVALALAVLAPPLAAETWTFELDPAATTVRFRLGATLHAVHGTLHAREGRIVLDPATGEASGRIVLDARSAETGNRRRDEKMHDKILESARHPEMIYTVRRVSGSLQPVGPSTLQLHGTLKMHGVERPLELLASADAAEGRVRANGEFTLPYREWGLKDPSFFVLRVAEQVDVEIDAVGRLTVDAADGDAAR